MKDHKEKSENNPIYDHNKKIKYLGISYLRRQKTYTQKTMGY